jgi:hypothetical protein
MLTGTINDQVLLEKDLSISYDDKPASQPLLPYPPPNFPQNNSILNYLSVISSNSAKIFFPEDKRFNTVQFLGNNLESLFTPLGIAAAISAKIPLKIFVGNIYILVQEIAGINLLLTVLLNNSVHLTEKTDEAAPFTNVHLIDAIVNEVLNENHIYEMAVTPAVSYLIQKVLEKCNNDQLLRVINIARPHLYPLSFHEYGTRFVQRILEKASGKNPHSLIVLEAFKNGKKTKDILNTTKCGKDTDNHIIPLFLNENSVHIIKKIIVFHRTHSDFLYPIIFESLTLLWKCKPGAYILQQFLDLFDRKNKGLNFFSLFFLELIF